MKKKVLIIGAGASGMTAAIYAARGGAQVTLIEHKDRVGKKILSTGNGRCNLTNLDQRDSCYRSSNEGFPVQALRNYTAEDALDFFRGLGILPKSRNGYMYPNSDQAASVLDVLMMELERLKVKTLVSCETEQIKKEGKLFVVKTDQGVFKGDALILAAGSKAAPVTGSDGSGYALAAGFGHKIIPPLPALVQLRCKEKHYKQLSGIRTDAKLSLYGNGRLLAEDQGELQLTDYGISGIPTFQISRYASESLHRKQRVTVVIDFLPQMSDKEAWDMLKERKEAMAYKTAEEWMNGLLNKKLSACLLKLAGISQGTRMSEVSGASIKALYKQLKSYETEVTATNPFENAQICCGGVDTRQVDPITMESRLVPGLYFCGELLDVDGICGGYNLQWAWTSGAQAGIHAGKEYDK